MTDIALDEKLLPCPFCGGKPETEPWHGGAPTKIMICCSNREYGDEHGGCSVGPMVTGETPEEAAAAWNRRASPSQVAPQPQAGEPVAVGGLYGPFGWLNGCRGLSEDSWELESDPLENSEEYFAIPLYALTDPFKEVGPLYAFPQPANPAQVTDATDEAVRLAGDILMSHGLNAPEQVIYRAAREILETAAIGAGGQAVADSLWVPAKPEHKKIGWTYDFDQTERLSRAAEKATGYEGTMEVIEFVMAEADRRHKSALSQPHPADERVVEALRRMLSLFDEQGNLIADFAQMQGAISNGYRVLSAKEGR